MEALGSTAHYIKPGRNEVMQCNKYTQSRLKASLSSPMGNLLYSQPCNNNKKKTHTQKKMQQKNKKDHVVLKD